jgi:uncharacterized protein YbbC (DUF1343 family)
MVQTGLENFLKSPPDFLKGQRLGLLCNPASVNASFQHGRILISRRLPGQLQALFTPQHGFYAEKQDNMIESKGLLDPVLNIPIFSLYGETRWPSSTMLDLIDVLLVDLQDVGTRVYTFIYTLSYCMERAAQLGKKVVILDRPNPIGGILVEGNVLEPEFRSFVGRYPIPMRHGMTIGELATLFNNEFGIHCDLSVVPMIGWNRSMYFWDTKLPWILPSPNLPTPASALVYPGQVIWEGTQVSEGRGTTLPFEMMGAPYIVPKEIVSLIGENGIPGVVLRKTGFEPTSNKWSGSLCRGFQLHVTSAADFRPYRASLTLLWAILKAYPDSFEWKTPPYEYEYERLPMDLILGSQKLRVALESGTHPSKLAESWTEELRKFDGTRQKYLIYE